MKDSRGKILEVAARLFAKKGYSNVSVREVCRGAGTTAPMIYYYFGDKRGLFNAAVSPRISMLEFINLLRARTRIQGAEEEVSAFIDTYLSGFPDRVFDLGLYMRDTAELDQKSTQRISKDLDEIHKIATSLVERGVRSGEFGKMDASRAADCLIGMLNHVIFQRIHFSKAQDIDSSRQFITNFFLGAVKHPAHS